MDNSPTTNPEVTATDSTETIVEAAPPARWPSLTGREAQVADLLSRGNRNKEIALHLDISVKTVDTHRGHVLKKLGLRGNVDLALYAIAFGYMETPTKAEFE